jgi:hypothetical protein
LRVRDKVCQRALKQRLIPQHQYTGDLRIPNISDISPPVTLDNSPHKQTTISPPSFTLVSRLEDETPPSVLYRTKPEKISQQATPSPPSFTLTSKIENESPPSAFDNITPGGLSAPGNKHEKIQGSLHLTRCNQKLMHVGTHQMCNCLSSLIILDVYSKKFTTNST